MHPATGQRMIDELRREGLTKREYQRRVRTATAQAVIRALLRHGLSQEKIAAAIGLTQAMISRYANGHSPPQIPTLNALLDLKRKHKLKVRGLKNGWREL